MQRPASFFGKGSHPHRQTILVSAFARLPRLPRGLKRIPLGVTYNVMTLASAPHLSGLCLIGLRVPISVSVSIENWEFRGTYPFQAIVGYSYVASGRTMWNVYVGNAF